MVDVRKKPGRNTEDFNDWFSAMTDFLGGDRLFMELARTARRGSRDRTTKVGCVIVGADGDIKSYGYNSFPDGVDDQVEERHQRPEKYQWTEHAERAAIYRAAKTGTSLKGSRIYLPWFPCCECARAIVMSGIKEVVGTEPDLSNPQWGESFKAASTILREGGVNVRFMAEECS